jgi:predicted RNA binding protein YcfA (HicA-like mRNA interferase family)
MPPRLPARLPTKQVHSALLRLGFFMARDDGPHTVYAYPGRPKVRFVLPRHAMVGRHLVVSALKDAGFSEQQVLDVF